MHLPNHPEKRPPMSLGDCPDEASADNPVDHLGDGGVEFRKEGIVN